ncbi:Gp138 family membrane-puncturing spike protein [Uliginosibacterium sp. sgz301328]|uniref:Gp138 family membrane-puncturing spike protein n=1 Tax=Uliginosibacterium sp. sgz301328 TaxID=3243764 RepID=UPI00359E3CAC
MRQIERTGDTLAAMKALVRGDRARLWTALPGIIQSFDAVAMTCTVQPALRENVRQEDGSTQSLQLPLLVDVPVVFPGGGSCTLTFPVKEGDECLVVFASRCIDAWWQQGGIQQQAEFRMHDLSDGFAFVGVRSQPRKFNVSTEAVQLRKDDGSAFVQIDVATGGILATTPSDIIANAGTSARVVAPEIFITGHVTINGDVDVNGEVTANGIPLSDHKHKDVVPGGGVSGVPVV